jgi:hypothetical protein
MTVPQALSCAAHFTRTAFAFALAREGSNIAIKSAIIATTTRSSISVKPDFEERLIMGLSPKNLAEAIEVAIWTLEEGA